MKLKNYALIFLFALLIVSCAKKDSPFVPVTLQSSSEQVSRAAGDLQTFIGSSGIILPSGALQYGTDLYTITYQTTYQGNTVTASAVVILPQTSTPVGMVCFNHGTIAAHSKAPSVQPLNSTEWIFYSALASPGFIAVIPDFLGFGSSASILHPYYVEDATAVPVMDAMKAARELAPGALLISNSFPVPTLRAERVVEVGDRRATRLYLYRVAPRASGRRAARRGK